MAKTKIANVPFGPFVTVLAGSTVDGNPSYATMTLPMFLGEITRRVKGCV